jgi:hypothetical protein
LNEGFEEVLFTEAETVVVLPFAVLFQIIVLIMVGAEEKLNSAPPLDVAKFAEKVQFVKVVEELSLFVIPPPKPAVFSEKALLVTVGEVLIKLYIPPPPEEAEFSEKAQAVTIGEEAVSLNIPPPKIALFPKNVLLVIVGAELLLL